MLFRRLRGIAGTALLWGLGWALITGGVAAASALVLRAYLGPLDAFRQGGLTGLSWGIAAGALFASALMLAEQRRGFAGLTLARAAVWGAVAGVWFPVLIGLAFGPGSLPLAVAGWPAYLVTGSMGALSGLVTLWLARRGPALGPGASDLAPGLPSDPPRPPEATASPGWAGIREAKPTRAK